MAVTTSIAYPNYSGVLYCKTNKSTPMLNLIGAPATTTHVEFALNQQYELGDPSQPAISEIASLTAPAPESVGRTQETNVTQIFQRTIEVSYGKMSNMGTLSGLNVEGQYPNPADELAFQQMRGMEKMVNDVEYTLINGTFHKATTDNDANKTRGILEAITTNAAEETGAVNSSSIRSVLKTFFKKMYDNGTEIDGNTLMMNSTIKAAISEAYEGSHFVVSNGFTLAGINIMDLLTDYGTMHIVLNSKMPANTLLCFNPAACRTVEQFTPGKGNFFYEELGKTGASEKGQIFGQLGFDYGAEFLHGKLVFGA